MGWHRIPLEKVEDHRVVNPEMGYLSKQEFLAPVGQGTGIDTGSFVTIGQDTGIDGTSLDGVSRVTGINSSW